MYPCDHVINAKKTGRGGAFDHPGRSNTPWETRTYMSSLSVFLGCITTSCLFAIIRLMGFLCNLVGFPFIQADVETLLTEMEAQFDRQLSLRSNPKWMEGLHAAVNLIKSHSGGGSAAQGRYLMRNCVRKFIICATLHVDRAIARHPEILSVPVRKPIFITGVGRSGSTLLHNLLSCYTDVRYLTYQEMQEPLPLDTNREFDPKWRQERERQWQLYCAVGTKTVLDLRRHSHPVNATGPEECTIVLRRYGFAALQLCLKGVYESTEWLLSNPSYVQEVYQAYRRELQLFLYYDSLCENRAVDSVPSRYVLKSFYHTPFIDVIKDVFPDAYIIRLHRDPVKTVPSLCSLTEALHHAYGGKMSRAEVGQDTLKWTDFVCKRMIDDGLPTNTLDISYENLIYDPVGVCARVAAFVGFDQNDEVVGHIQRYLDVNHKQRYGVGVHMYSPEMYGLSGTDIRRRLRQYCEKFKV